MVNKIFNSVESTFLLTSHTMKKVLSVLAALSICFAISFSFKSSYKPKVYDCFLFYDEFDALNIRLSELKDKVEKFILIEASRTFQNKPKPLFFAENKEKYAEYKDKIVHVVIDQFPEFSPIGNTDWWELENFQRDRLKIGLNLCKPHPRDIIIFTDADEIVRKEKAPQEKVGLWKNSRYRLALFYFGWLSKDLTKARLSVPCCQQHGRGA